MYQAMKQIQQLREQGWKVHVRMERVVGEIKGERYDQFVTAARHEVETGQNFNAKGGNTTVTLVSPDGTEFIGETRCHSRLDNFSRKIGLEIALGRALKQINTDVVKT